jgi:hypothetical protein
VSVFVCVLNVCKCNQVYITWICFANKLCEKPLRPKLGLKVSLDGTSTDEGAEGDDEEVPTPRT